MRIVEKLEYQRKPCIEKKVRWLHTVVALETPDLLFSPWLCVFVEWYAYMQLHMLKD